MANTSVAEAEAQLRAAAVELEKARERERSLATLPETTTQSLTEVLTAITAAESAERRNPHDVEAIVRAHAAAIRALIALERDRQPAVSDENEKQDAAAGEKVEGE
jgi:hypothetical protein